MLTRRVHLTYHAGWRLSDRFPHLTEADLPRLVLTASSDPKLVAAAERWFTKGGDGGWRHHKGLVVRVNEEYGIGFLLEITDSEYRVVSVGYAA